MNNTFTAEPKAFKDFKTELLAWYVQNARDMPWRIPPQAFAQGQRQEPYKVWLSEIMLQQTQVATVAPYFLKFMDLWPNVQSLADADLVALRAGGTFSTATFSISVTLARVRT